MSGRDAGRLANWSVGATYLGAVGVIVGALAIWAWADPRLGTSRRRTGVE